MRVSRTRVAVVALGVFALDQAAGTALHLVSDESDLLQTAYLAVGIGALLALGATRVIWAWLIAVALPALLPLLWGALQQPADLLKPDTLQELAAVVIVMGGVFAVVLLAGAGSWLLVANGWQLGRRLRGHEPRRAP